MKIHYLSKPSIKESWYLILKTWPKNHARKIRVSGTFVKMTVNFGLEKMSTEFNIALNGYLAFLQRKGFIQNPNFNQKVSNFSIHKYFKQLLYTLKTSSVISIQRVEESLLTKHTSVREQHCFFAKKYIKCQIMSNFSFIGSLFLFF